jgi:hypothetical protein
MNLILNKIKNVDSIYYYDKVFWLDLFHKRFSTHFMYDDSFFLNIYDIRNED